jgi:hypothetical protein
VLGMRPGPRGPLAGRKYLGKSNLVF